MVRVGTWTAGGYRPRRHRKAGDLSEAEEWSRAEAEGWRVSVVWEALREVLDYAAWRR